MKWPNQSPWYFSMNGWLNPGSDEWLQRLDAVDYYWSKTVYNYEPDRSFYLVSGIGDVYPAAHSGRIWGYSVHKKERSPE